jgi:hypothetical protein
MRELALRELCFLPYVPKVSAEAHRPDRLPQTEKELDISGVRMILTKWLYITPDSRPTAWQDMQAVKSCLDPRENGGLEQSDS